MRSPRYRMILNWFIFKTAQKIIVVFCIVLQNQPPPAPILVWEQQQNVDGEREKRFSAHDSLFLYFCLALLILFYQNLNKFPNADYTFVASSAVSDWCEQHCWFADYFLFFNSTRDQRVWNVFGVEIEHVCVCVCLKAESCSVLFRLFK